MRIKPGHLPAFTIGLNCVPHDRYVDVPTPTAWNVTLFGKRVFTEEVKLR